VRRVDEETVGRLRVDDETILLFVLTDGKHAVDCLRCARESDHALLVKPADELDILVSTAGDARRLEWFRSIQKEYLVSRSH
jgi:hypothetical protein